MSIADIFKPKCEKCGKTLEVKGNRIHIVLENRNDKIFRTKRLSMYHEKCWRKDGKYR